MRKLVLVTLLILSMSIVMAIDQSKTDVCDDYGSIVAPSKLPTINYTVEWTITLGHVASVGLTPVGDTLLWVSSGGRTSNADPNWILIYNLRTSPPTLVDSFLQAATTLWGYRDMCFYNGYVYAGTEATLHKIDPVTHAVVGTYSVTGISGSVIRALTDNDVEDSLWTSNWNVPIYKFWNQGGAVRTVASNTYSIYGLGYDPHGYVWGSCQNQPSADLVKYSYPGFTVLDFARMPELVTDELAGGCEMWRDTFLLYLGQCDPLDKVFCLRLYTPSLTDDVGVDAIMYPTGSHRINTAMVPIARVKNYGANNQTNFAVVCSIVGPAGIFRYTDTKTISLASGIDTLVSFNSWIPTVAELESVKVRTNLAGDVNPANDRKTSTVLIGDWLLMEGFNGTTFPPTGWQAIILQGTHNWERKTSNTDPTCIPYEGEAMASYQAFDELIRGANARLISPPLALGTTPVICSLKFFMYHDDGYPPPGTFGPDSVRVEYSLDGTNFTRVAAFCRYSPTNGWVAHSVNLGTFSGTVYLGLLAWCDYGNNMNIDYVRLFSYTPGIEEANSNTLPKITSLSASKPNPITNGLAKISFTIAEPTKASLKIYDASGRMVRTLVNSKLDRGIYNLTWNGTDNNNNAVAEGIYFYTLTTDNNNYTKKLVFTR